MGTYIDVHKNLKGATLQEVAEAHAKDLAVQEKHGVKFLKCWVDQKAGMVFCLSEAPDIGAPTRVHKEAHGLLPDETFETSEVP
ncbi:MAG: DUF4242 domain-containing protein [Thaumarchaeota archaeon]|jgi:hypothetical protein|nr:DUF4242 domain-containing protein [Nitrososphaerota archaeon]